MSPCAPPARPASGYDGWCANASPHILSVLITLPNLFIHVVVQPLPEWEYNGNVEQVGYRVQYSRVGSQGRALIHVIADRLEREFTIEDLEEWTEYEVRVQAVNGIGTGPWSQPVRGRTRESGERGRVRSAERVSHKSQYQDRVGF